MRALLIPTLIVALLGSTSVVAGEPSYASNGNIEPVYVQVDSQGKITEIAPAYPLSDGLKRLLRTNLNEMIHTPAIGKDGKPVSSQFIINVALQTEPRDSGDYSAQFTYVSTLPLPPGRCSWVRGIKGQEAVCGGGQVARGRPIGGGRAVVPDLGTGMSIGGSSVASAGGRHSR